MKKAASILFHRTALVGLLLVLQVAILVVVMARFASYFIYFYLFCVVVSILVVLWIVNSRTDPGYKIAWIVPILLAPVFGGLVYLLSGGNQLSVRMRRKMEGMDRRLTEVLSDGYKADILEEQYGADAVNQSRYLERYAHCPLCVNTDAKYYPLGDDVFADMLEALRGAKRYIFLEYFIIDRGLFWNSILDILEEKARAGVDVRVIYDDVGCLYTLPKNYPRELEARGIRCQVFNRFIPVLSVRLNNRDHRKFCIVDGHTAFTGGINLADEYINQKLRYGHWKDTAILLKGEAVWSMTVMFLTMWEYTRDVEEDYRRFRPDKLPPEAAQGAGYYVQPYADNPLDEEAVGEAVYLNLINKAERYVYAMTPYLIISDSVNTALCNAAKSGVDVRIITPHIPDKALVFELTRSHYESLLEAGVQIFEYTPGFVHAKVMVTDDCCGVVGSINLDYRSMFLHFEDAVLLYHDPTVLDIKRDFINTQFRSQPVTLEQCLGHSWIRRLFRSILRVLAPLL